MSDECATIVIIKRSGADGPRFPLRRNECLFGRDAACDLRVQLPGVALEHAKLSRTENCEFYLESLTDGETMINGDVIKEPIELNSMDIFSIAGRSFRFEYVRPKQKSLGLKKLNDSKNNSGHLASPLQDVNSRVVRDSPRNPLSRRSSLRESMGKLRRSSVPFQELEEPVSNTPGKTEVGKVCIVNAIPPNESYTDTPVSIKKQRKRVSFGPQLSPEQFDKKLPVSTPIKKGGTPRRLSAPLSKPCLSPARRRYSVAASSFVSKIEEEADENDDISENEIKSPQTESPAVEIVEVSRTELPRLATPLRTAIKEGKKLRGTKKKMGTPLKNAIKQGFRLKKNKKKLNTPLRKQIQAGRKLKPTRKRLNTPVRKAIESRPKLRATRMKMPTPVRKGIEAKPSLRQTKRLMEKDLQEEIKKGKSLKQTKNVMSGPLQEEIKTGRKFLRIKRRMKSELQEEILAGKELNATKRKMAAELQAEIAKGIQLRPTRKRMPIMLQNEIKAGIELSKTKQSLETPVRKAIESGVSLRKTKRRMATMLQEEIQAGIELSKTKQSLKTPVRKEIESGVSLRKTKQRMATMLQEEIQAGIELSKTKQSLKTPLRKEIESGVNLRKTKRGMATMLQTEIQAGIELPKTKQSAKTTPRKEIKSTKDDAQPPVSSKTPKRRLSCVDDNVSQSARKKLKTPSKTPQQAGFFPSTRSKTRSISRRKSIKKPSYAEILKRPKLVVKRRLSTKKKNVFEFEAEQKEPVTKATTSKTSSTTAEAANVKNKTPSRRKSQARNKVFDGKKSDDWNIVVNKRKIKRIKRQRAVKPNQETDLDGIPSLFKTPKVPQSQARTKNETTKVDRPIRKCRQSSSPGDNVLYGVAILMKTPKANYENCEPNYEGVKELFERPIRKCRPSSSPGDNVLHGVAKLMKTPKANYENCEPNYEGVKELFERPTRESKQRSSLGDSVLFGVAKLMKTPKTDRDNNEPNYEGVAELFEEFEMSSPIAVTSTPSLRRASGRVSIVTPLTINKTPSLRMKEDTNNVVLPLQLSSTPSLRQSQQNLTVVSPEEPLRTPSLRRPSENLTVVFAEEPQLTPSLRGTADNLFVVAAEEPIQTPSPKRAAEKIVLASPLQGNVTPSLKSTAPAIVVASPTDQRLSTSTTAPGSTDVSKSTTIKKQSETVAVVSPFPVEPTQLPSLPTSSVELSPPLEQPTLATVPPSPPAQHTLPSADLISKPPTPPEEPSTSNTVGAKKSTRSKRKAEPGTLPAPKRPRRTTSRNNTHEVVTENVKSGTELSSGRANTNVDDGSAVSRKRKTSSRSAKRSVSVDGQKNGMGPSQEFTDVVERADDEVKSTSERNTRASRRKPTNEKPNSKAKSRSNPTPKITRSEKSKNVAGIPETPQPLEFTRTKLEPIIEVPTPASSLRCSSVKKPAFVGLAEIKNQRSTRSRRNITTVVEEVEEPVVMMSQNKNDDFEKQDTVPKRRGIRAKRAAAVRGDEKIKTPEKDVTENKRASRSKRNIDETNKKSVAEQSSGPISKTTRSTRSTQPVAPKEINAMAKDLKNANVLADTSETVSKDEHNTRSKRAVCAIGKAETDMKSIGKRRRGKISSPVKDADEKVTSEKRSTRAKRGMPAVAEEENLPAPKRQKKTEERTDDEPKEDDNRNASKQEKQTGRQTRRTAGGHKVVEELTISNKKSTRSQKPVSKEIEIVEETVVKYRRTTRQTRNAVEEDGSETKSEKSTVKDVKSGKRARKGNNSVKTEEDFGCGRKLRTTRMRQTAAQENNSLETGKEEMESRRSKQTKAQDTKTKPPYATESSNTKRNTTDKAKKDADVPNGGRRSRSQKILKEEPPVTRTTRSRCGGK